MCFNIIGNRVKILGINPMFHITDKKLSTALKKATATMDIHYPLVPQRNHRSNNEEISVHTLKSHFI